MDFESLQTDDAYVEDSQGRRSGPFKTKFAGSSLTFFDEHFHVDEGDSIIQPLPGGRQKKYRVIEAQYRTGLHAIPAHYAVKVQTGAASTPAPAPSNTFNFSGSNNVQIGDHNSQHITSTFQALITDIDKSSCTPAEKAEAKSKLVAFLESPATTAILGGIAQGLAGQIRLG